MADEKQMTAIRRFCAKPIADHGARRAGVYGHDWSTLVNDICYFDYGRAQKEPTVLLAVGQLVRTEFPNASDWNRRVNAEGAHDRILAIIREGLKAHLPAEVQKF